MVNLLLLTFYDSYLEAAFWANGQTKGSLLATDKKALVLTILIEGALIARCCRLCANGAAIPLLPQGFAAALVLYVACQLAVTWGTVKHRDVYYRRYRDAAIATQRIIRTLVLLVLSFTSSGVLEEQYLDYVMPAGLDNGRIVYQGFRVLIIRGCIAFGWLFMAQFPLCWRLNFFLHVAYFPVTLSSVPCLVRAFQRPGMMATTCAIASKLDFLKMAMPLDGSCHTVAAPLVVYSVSACC